MVNKINQSSSKLSIINNQSSIIRVVFFGSSRYVLPVIEVLNKNFNLFLVVTTEKQPTDPLIAYCKSKSIPTVSVSSSENLSSIINRQLSLLKASLGVIADFGIIIPNAIIEAFPKAIINIHPSLLPKHRGPTPVQTAILQGDQKTGVTIIKIDEEVDHGPILYQEEMDILPEDTSETMLVKLFQKGANSLSKTISGYIKGSIIPTEQIHSNATFTHLLKKQDGYIDLSIVNNRSSIININRMIRAFYPWPGVWTLFRLSSKGQAKVIKLLPDGKVQVEGKRPMSYGDFINGYEKGEEFLKKVGLL